MHRRVHPGHLPPCHPADAAGDGRHHRLRHWQGDVIISQKKRRPGRESPSGPAQSQHFQRTVLYYRLFSNSANIFGCGPSMSRFSARSVPLHTPVWVTVWSEKNGKSKPLQRVLKNEKKPCKSHGFARLCHVLRKKIPVFCQV